MSSSVSGVPSGPRLLTPTEKSDTDCPLPLSETCFDEAFWASEIEKALASPHWMPSVLYARSAPVRSVFASPFFQSETVR